jgi:diguanylate cyclase (GGDEF)-like protein
MDSTKDVLKFASLAGLVSAIVASTIGTASLVLGGYGSFANFDSIWSVSWMADGLGIILVAPVVIPFISDPRDRWNWKELFETAGLTAGAVAVGLVVFGGFLISGTRKYPLEFMCVPFLMWAAFRFGQREVSIAALALSTTAVRAALHRATLSGSEPRYESSTVMLQMFLAVTAVFAMALAAEFSERRRAEARARFLAGSDLLTGLGNYRNLFDSLDSEIRRSERTRRPFAFLLMDMDGLKTINDEHGHVAGNRALCRLAQVLRLQCRELDTAARYGGDEFALVIPEAGAEAARQVARRIRERLNGDGEFPPLSVSIGAAVFPDDGRSIDTLLRAADRDLYDLKAAPAAQVRPRKIRDTRSPEIAISGFAQIKSQTQ